MRCAVDVAPLRAEPDEAAEQVTQALRGESLEVEERQDGWARVRTAYDYPGLLGACPRGLIAGSGGSSRYGEPADHIAFWLGEGRILHSTGRESGIGVIEEPEPSDLRGRRHKLIRL